MVGFCPLCSREREAISVRAQHAVTFALLDAGYMPEAIFRVVDFIAATGSINGCRWLDADEVPLVQEILAGVANYVSLH